MRRSTFRISIHSVESAAAGRTTLPAAESTAGASAAGRAVPLPTQLAKRSPVVRVPINRVVPNGDTCSLRGFGGFGGVEHAAVIRLTG